MSALVCKSYGCFFFFQAEDGIRDYKVTGVQRVLFRSVVERLRGDVVSTDSPRQRKDLKFVVTHQRPKDRHARGVSDRDRKSTRLNSSHLVISYAVFCLKKKKQQQQNRLQHTPYETTSQ